MQYPPEMLRVVPVIVGDENQIDGARIESRPGDLAGGVESGVDDDYGISVNERLTCLRSMLEYPLPSARAQQNELCRLAIRYR